MAAALLIDTAIDCDFTESSDYITTSLCYLLDLQHLQSNKNTQTVQALSVTTLLASTGGATEPKVQTKKG